MYCSYFTHILWKFVEVLYCQTQIPLIFVILFSGTGQCFYAAQKKNLENQKFSHVKIGNSEWNTVFLVNIPGLNII